MSKLLQKSALMLGLVGLGLPAGGYAADNPQTEGVEVLARGPVHEAYAEPVSGRPVAAPIINRQPPEAVAELPADQKPEGQDVQWIPGYWGWDEDRNDFLWISGFWRVPPPGRQWVPGRWNQVDGGWQWVPGFWSLIQEQQQIVYLPAPPPPIEAAASVPAPAADSVYISGNWVYREGRFRWRAGYWCNYRPGWVWVPAHYVWTPCGYVFVDGYWDYTLRGRGLLFAPVRIDTTIALQPNWFYRPRYIVYDECMFGALFVRPECHHYYFGDYFEPSYRQRGFTAWFEFRLGRTGYDPLYSYYRWDHREDRRWDTGLRDLYVGRYEGQIARPPHTLVQQTTLLQNITNNNTTINNSNTNITNTTINNNTVVNNISNVTMLAPLSQVNTNIVHLQTVDPAAQQQQAESAHQFRQASAQRAQLESQVAAQTPPAAGASVAPQAIHLDLPAVRPAARASAAPASTPPPLPVKTEAPIAVANTLTAPLPGPSSTVTPTAGMGTKSKPAAAVPQGSQNAGTAPSSTREAMPLTGPTKTSERRPVTAVDPSGSQASPNPSAPAPARNPRVPQSVPAEQRLTAPGQPAATAPLSTPANRMPAVRSSTPPPSTSVPPGTSAPATQSRHAVTIPPVDQGMNPRRPSANPSVPSTRSGQPLNPPSARTPAPQVTRPQPQMDRQSPVNVRPATPSSPPPARTPVPQVSRPQPQMDRAPPVNVPPATPSSPPPVRTPPPQVSRPQPTVSAPVRTPTPPMNVRPATPSSPPPVRTPPPQVSRPQPQVTTSMKPPTPAPPVSRPAAPPSPPPAAKSAPPAKTAPAAHPNGKNSGSQPGQK